MFVDSPTKTSYRGRSLPNGRLQWLVQGSFRRQRGVDIQLAPGMDADLIPATITIYRMGSYTPAFPASITRGCRRCYSPLSTCSVLCIFRVTRSELFLALNIRHDAEGNGGQSRSHPLHPGDRLPHPQPGRDGLPGSESELLRRTEQGGYDEADCQTAGAAWIQGYARTGSLKETFSGLMVRMVPSVLTAQM